MPSMLKMDSTITEPAKRPGNKVAETVISGNKLLRNTCRQSTSFSFTPLARAVRA
jgi:hypothetical protein